MADSGIEKELKECPFCGGELFIAEIRLGQYKVFCKNDCFILPSNDYEFFTSRKQAVQAANKRSYDNDMR